MFSRPVSSGWNPVPTSSRLPTRPWTSTSPSVGSVIRERIFSSVLFPAPLRPMIPTTSPGRTSNDTSFNAQNGGFCSERFLRPSNALRGADASLLSWSRRVVYRSRGPPSRYSLPRPSTRTASSLIPSRHIGKGSFHPPEVKQAAGQQDQHHPGGDSHHSPVRGVGIQERPPEALHDPGHRVETIEQAVLRRYQAGRVGNRGQEHPELGQKRNRVPDVAVLDVQGRQPQPDGQGGQHREQGEYGDSQDRSRRLDGEPAKHRAGSHHPNHQAERHQEVDKPR